MFHVPEAARFIDPDHSMGSTVRDGNNGAFEIPSPEPGWSLSFIASDGGGWEHVSVRAVNDRRSRIPTWREMTVVKECCWDDDDTVMQLHPPRRDYINCHPHVLHLWRPIGREIPMPPSEFVGPRLAVTR